ncbi:MAG: dihydrodipicolinate synthase family protein, partial [Planctomycetaceae bacterium]|nr:dihydrodipicolinate synthase family protein [Planctomycetaceae bacterium]
MQPLRGVIPPLLTPLQSRDSLDLPGLERLIEHVLGGGVHGLFVLGTTGEAPSLSHRLQREMVLRSLELVAGRVPVLVGITDTSVEESLALAEVSAEAGAEAVVVAAPHYFPMHQDDLERYVRELAAELALPFFLYNMPSHSKVAYEIGTVERLLDLPNLLGIKDSSGQMLYFHKLLHLAQQRDGFVVLMGPEELLAESVLMGGHGGVCGGANLCPQLYVQLYEAAVAEDLRLVQQL